MDNKTDWKMWVVCLPEGGFPMMSTATFSRSDSIKRFLKKYSNLSPTWKKWYRKGYRCERKTLISGWDHEKT